MQSNNYLLDVCFAIDGGIQLKTYKIEAATSALAFQKWQDCDTVEFPIVYEGDVVPAIIVGIQQVE